MPKNDKREYRSMPVMAVERAEGEEEQGYKVRGYATTFDEPYPLFEDLDGKDVYEVIDPHAFDGADMTDVILQYDHMGMVYARTRNGSLTLAVDEHGLMIEADLGLTAAARELYAAISTGLVDRMSFCFIIEDEKYDAATRTWRIMKLGKIYDVSAVSIPANPGTEISSERKQRMDGVIQEERAERLAKEARMRRIRMLKVKAKLAGARG